MDLEKLSILFKKLSEGLSHQSQIILSGSFDEKETVKKIATLQGYTGAIGDVVALLAMTGLVPESFFTERGIKIPGREPKKESAHLKNSGESIAENNLSA